MANEQTPGAEDPFRRRGERGVTKRTIQKFAVRLKIARALARQGALSAAELKQLAHGFRPSPLMDDMFWFGVVPRLGREGGVQLINPEALAKHVAQLEQLIGVYKTSPDMWAIAGPILDQPIVPLVTLDALAAAARPADGQSSIEGSSTEGSSPQSSTWKDRTVHFLASRYTAEELTALVPPKFAAEWNRSRGLPSDAPLGTPTEIAESLVLLYDTDLLANATELRERIAADLGLPALKRFHPGSSAARAFVQRAGLPQELAGTLEPERAPAVMQVASHRLMPELVDYQASGREQIVEIMRAAGRAIYSVPTGGGKTRTAWEAVFDHVAALQAAMMSEDGAGRNVVIWLAHRNELLDQACECLHDVWRSRTGRADALLVRLWGRNTRDAIERIQDFDLPAQDCVIVVTTPATMAAMLVDLGDHRAPRLRQAIIERTGVVLVDEAHRGAAQSYVRIIDALRNNEAQAPVALVGLTATPFRGTGKARSEEETLKLIEVFQQVMVPPELGWNPQQRLVRRKILARPVFDDLDTGVMLNIEAKVNRLLAKNRGAPLSAGQEEMVDRWLAAAASRSPERQAEVFKIVLERAQSDGVHMLYFGPSVANAQLMAVALTRAGISAAVVSGATRAWTRRRLIEAFRDGKIRVLCNCEVLTAGFDAPLVTHVVVARPTMSLVLYQQMIGRGLRGPKFGGTDSCVIVNCIDRIKMGPLSLGHARYRAMWEEGANAEE